MRCRGRRPGDRGEGPWRMMSDWTLKTSVALIAAVALSAAAYQAEGVFAPLTLALFIIALVWPMQHWLQARMPALIALMIRVGAPVAVMPGLASLGVWGFARVGRSLIVDSSRYQAIYDAV